MSRPADQTRHELVEAATAIFAAHGFERGSVRDIARAAGANQAAISSHFGGKEGLYRAVLERSIAAFEIPAFDAARMEEMDRADAVRLFLRAQLASIGRRGELNQYLRIFAWEKLARNVFGT